MWSLQFWIHNEFVFDVVREQKNPHFFWNIKSFSKLLVIIRKIIICFAFKLLKKAFVLFSQDRDAFFLETLF